MSSARSDVNPEFCGHLRSYCGAAKSPSCTATSNNTDRVLTLSIKTMKKTMAKSRPTRSDIQRQAILDAASLLFIEKGFGGTNFNDIADAVGMTRTALYYYFRSKEAMLESLTTAVTKRAGDLIAEVIQQEDLSPDEALRQLILHHAGLVLQHPLQFRVAERSESSLPEELRKEAQASRRAVRRGFVAVIERGIAEGMFRTVDADIAAFSIIGMCNWCAWWFDSRAGKPTEPIAELIASFGLRMLSRTDASSETANNNQEIDLAMAQMRDAMEKLTDSLERR